MRIPFHYVVSGGKVKGENERFFSSRIELFFASAPKHTLIKVEGPLRTNRQRQLHQSRLRRVDDVTPVSVRNSFSRTRKLTFGAYM